MSICGDYVLLNPSLRLLIFKIPLGGIVAQPRLGAVRPDLPKLLI
ncbi:MAG: hypothetical protein ACXWP0_17315 [Ktedonobacterales bacterium]